ncbi:MAG: succinate dehydrogenase [Chloroflexi bacterium]|nr:succinate dehydrogenase [Chloroflexota bacterium]
MTRLIAFPKNFEITAWKWMRYSGLLLIPLAWGHVLIQDVLVGVDRIDLNYVSMRWAYLGWRAYDLFLLVFALAHGINGLRQVVLDFFSTRKNIRWLNQTLLALWLVLVLAGIAALVGGVRKP